MKSFVSLSEKKKKKKKKERKKEEKEERKIKFHALLYICCVLPHHDAEVPKNQVQINETRT